MTGATLRARHLYTGRIVERSIEEVDDLLTLVNQARTLTTAITEAWLGRVRGIKIRFRDRRTPLEVGRADPGMHQAKELIEAIVYRMAEKCPLDVEVVNFQGQPLIRRIFWKTS